MRRLFPALAAAFLAAISSARADDLFEVIPGEAKVVVSAANPQKTLEAFKDFAAGVGKPLPEDPLAKLKETFPEGSVKLDQPAALVVLELGGKEPVAVVTVGDASAALEKLHATKDGDYSKFTVKDKTMFALSRGALLVVADDSGSLEAFKKPAKTLTIAGNAAKMRESSDVFVYVNWPEIKPLADNGLQQASGAIEMIVGIAGAQPGQDPEAMRAQFTAMLNAAKRIVSDASGVHVGFKLSKDRVDAKFGLDLTPGSELAKMIGASSGASVDLLAGLPKDPYAVAYGADMSRIREPLLAFSKESMKKSPELIEIMEATSAATTTGNAVFGVGGKGLTMVGRNFTPDPAAVVEKLTKIYSGLKTIPNQGMKMTVSSSTQTIKGVKVLDVSMEVTEGPDQAKEMMKAMFGSSMKTQMAPLDKSVGYGLNVDPDVVSRLQGVDGLSSEANVKLVTDALPSKPMAVMLIDPFGILEVVKVVKSAVPLPIPDFPIPTKRPPPFGMGLGGTESGLVGQIHVEAATVAELMKLTGN